MGLHPHHTHIVRRCIRARIIVNIEGVEFEGERQAPYQAALALHVLEGRFAHAQVHHPLAACQICGQCSRQDDEEREVQKDFRPHLEESFLPQGKNHEHTECSPKQDEGDRVVDVLRHEGATQGMLHQCGHGQYGDEQQVEDEGYLLGHRLGCYIEVGKWKIWLIVGVTRHTVTRLSIFLGGIFLGGDFFRRGLFLEV